MKKNRIYSIFNTSILLFLLSCSNAFNNNTNPQQNEEEIEHYFSEDFETPLDSSIWTLNGINANIIDNDEKITQYIQYANAITDYHNKIVKLSKTDISKTTVGISSLTLNTIEVTEESALSFDYKTDIQNIDDISIYVDDTKIEYQFHGISQRWSNHSLILQPGTHKIEWFVGKDSANTSFDTGNIQNALYIDNISLSPNVVNSVEVFPKGLQETYVNGFELTFTAKALRSDGTEILGKNPTFTTSGGTIDNNGLFTPGNNSGTFNVTATIDGILGSNNSIKIHKENYLSDPITIADITFTGSDREYTIEELNGEIYADGFIVLKGFTNQNFMIEVSSSEDEETSPFYIEAGNYYQRIWLFSGSSTSHEMQITKIENLKRINTGDVRYKGDFDPKVEWNSSHYASAIVYPKDSNKIGDSSLYFMMPSYFCQSDDFHVTNIANSIKDTLPKYATKGDMLRAIHDWQLENLHYDDDSVKELGIYRKTQDAVNVINYKMAVCDGYACVFTALERALNFQGRHITSQSLGHAWNNTYYNNQWLLIDTTWDDGESTTSKDYTENYKYFLLTKEQDLSLLNSHDCEDESFDYR